MKILLIGRGRMGRLIQQTAAAAGDTVVEALGRDNLRTLDTMGRVADVVMDFSAPETLDAVAAYVRRTGTPLLSGTTGYTPAQLEVFQELGRSAPVLYSANFSVGMAVLLRVLSQISGVLRPDFDVEILEVHHSQKADAPSGTAKLLLEAVDPRHEMTPVYGREGACGKRSKNEVGMHAIRGGTIAGTHSIQFLGTDEVLELTHTAISRQIFVNGALHMARKLQHLPSGTYNLQDILFGEKTV